MNLSQDEINAMLSGTADSPPAEAEAAAEPQFEVDGFLTEYAETLEPGNGDLTPVEIDTLGEVGNICMGAVATTMYMLLDRRVDITTPRVSVLTTNDVLSMYQVPFVVVEVEYTEGIIGKNLLLLKEEDAALITDVLMGGEGVVEHPIELSELHMSAINEIMNQMIGASATALSQVIGEPVNISTPVSRRMSLETDSLEALGSDDLVIVITFDMEIEGLLSSQLVQFMPYDQGRAMSAMLISSAEEPEPAPAPEPIPAPAPVQQAPPLAQQAPPPVQQSAEYPPMQVSPAMSPQLQQMYSEYERPAPPVPGELVDVRPMHFDSFDDAPEPPEHEPSGIDTIYNIPLVVAAELGTTRRNLSEVLAFEPGVVIMLEKSAGDPVEVMINGKKIARGEVVVIDDNYGVRITELFEG